MSLISASGIHVRHAITRALSTMNRAPSEATWRVVVAAVTLDTRGRVAGAEVSIRMEEPRPGSGEEGVVNPDGLHPLMAGVPGVPGLLMDVFPVTWDRWCRVGGGTLPPGIDPWCPRTGVALEAASDWARAVGKRLPDAGEFRAAWGRGRYPWGDQANAQKGRDAPPRYREIPEAGMHPPTAAGLFDLGAWLWHWTAEGPLLGGAPGLVAAEPGAEPCGFRCVQEL